MVFPRVFSIASVDVTAINSYIYAMSRLVLFFSPLLCGLASLAAPLRAQEAMTLDDAIHAARTRSVAALQAKHAFVSTYWAWRSYQASRLPLLTLYGNLGNFNRSQTLLQNFESGEMVYANSYNMQNSLGLALTQNIALTATCRVSTSTASTGTLPGMHSP